MVASSHEFGKKPTVSYRNVFRVFRLEVEVAVGTSLPRRLGRKAFYAR
ncbi:MAG: hypothetical protein KatS3mg105_0229 [Gemmatales bacterium]|nr:MAG: hypothetical protein KatS3mg105_0229 [Gemmatales bacterium]